MMKRISIFTLTMLLGAASLWARPGYTKPIDVKQPDGTTVTLMMHGDEFLSFMTTTDGYTVMKGEDGYYRYAEKQDGSMKCTSMIARNPEMRTSGEHTFLAQAKKYVHADMNEASVSFKERASQMYAHNYATGSSYKHRVQGIWDLIDYSKFKGLVVLVEWKDRKFGTENPQEFYKRMTNEKNLVDNSKKYYPVPVTGSVKDYFYDNSLGIFEPTFDVVGPVTIDYSCKYPMPKNQDGTVNSGFDGRMTNILKATMSKVNTTVDFNDYDLNNDGIIDMVFFVFAGYGSYVQGNDYHYMWPHAEDLSYYASSLNMIYDNKRFGRYACSMEIQDYEDYAHQHVWLDGIGTMCHEFSHVLGLADHYDTDYERNGQARTAGGYDVMDGGADWNYGLNPVGYNAFERHILAFAEPEVLDIEGQYELAPFGTSNQAYRVKTKKTDEEFYLENRQETKWDAYLPQLGLLVWRADTSKPTVWKQNNVNISPNSMYFELLGNASFTEQDLTAETNSIWAAKGAAIDLYGISYKGKDTITFETGKDIFNNIVEDFETLPLTTADAADLKGRLCTWSLNNAVIAAVQSNYGTGENLVKFSKGGMLTSSKFDMDIHSMSFTLMNSGQAMRFALRTSTDGQQWTILTNSKGKSTIEIAAGQSMQAEYRNIPAGSYIQFVASSTRNAVECYLDDVVFKVRNESTGISNTTAGKKEKDARAVFNLSGQKVSNSYHGLVISDGKKIIRH